ncbi:MAG: tyrosine-type recombinase/integrase [Nocardioides sp.]
MNNYPYYSHPITACLRLWGALLVAMLKGMESPTERRPFREVEALAVRELGRIAAVDRMPGFVVQGPDGDELVAVTDWLLQLTARDCSVHTIRAYALSVLRFMRFLWAVEVTWQRATEVEVRDFVLWAKQAAKFSGNKRPEQPRGRVNIVTGKPYPTDRYSPKTINHTLTAVSEFFSFQLELGCGPLVNPVPGAGQRRHAGHNPEEDFRHTRRGSLRQKEPSRVPRSIPDAQFNQFFRRLGSNRDRALVTFYVSSGARASEVLGLTGEMINYGDQLICITSKGGELRWVPASPDAFVWLRLYELERGTVTGSDPVWVTLREPRRPMTYGAFRAVLNKINGLLGSNWTSHDLRHTFAVRALDGGMPLHEVQELLGHASLATTTIYTKPRMDEVIAHHRSALSRKPAGEVPATEGYDADELSTLFEGQR